MRYKVVFSTLFSLLFGTANANWSKINDVDYTWGPFNIYHITLFTETGKYEVGTRPLMLTLQYKKPWAGRDFAVSLARTWKNLGIELPENEVDEVINKLRKNFPDIKPEDTLHYIALEDRGYFILNDRVVSENFNKAFNDAIVAIWLDPKMDISHQLLDPSYKPLPKPAEPAIAEMTANEKNPSEAEHSVTDTSSKQTEIANVENIATKENNISEPASQVADQAKTEEKAKEDKTQENKADQPKEEVPKLQIENPELFISPVYDDIQMLIK